MKEAIYIAAVMLFGGWAGGVYTDEAKPAKAANPPIVTEAQKLKIRELQLSDVRISDTIKQRQLEIVNLQQQQASNFQNFRAYVAGLCNTPDGKYEFDLTSDQLQCVEKKQPMPEKK